jgi:hypothetical protein
LCLALRPELTINVMEELWELSLRKVFAMRLSVVEAMNNPHIDDDFHRILIQYLKNGYATLDFKENSPFTKLSI